MARAAGCKTYKLKFGNRGHNQPVKDMLTDKVHSIKYGIYIRHT